MPRLHHPLQYGPIGHLPSVITDDRQRLAAPLDDLGEFGQQAPPRVRRFPPGRQALLREVIDHSQGKKPLLRRELVGN
jgi:hypothetical protein